MAALLNISADHPDAENRLLAACCQALQSLGAGVSVRQGADNVLRLRVPSEHIRPFAPRAPARSSPLRADALDALECVASVEVEGLPNLLHELVHVALAGRLADDHGYDYGAIPYDLATIGGRSVLWEEIACCVVSCAYLAPPGEDATTTIDAWFAEQLGIQPLFYGMEGDPVAFFARVESLAPVHTGELNAMIDCAYERVRHLLSGHVDDATPVRRLAFAPLWGRWRSGSAGAAA